VEGEKGARRLDKSPDPKLDYFSGRWTEKNGLSTFAATTGKGAKARKGEMGALLG